MMLSRGARSDIYNLHRGVNYLCEHKRERIYRYVARVRATEQISLADEQLCRVLE